MLLTIMMKVYIANVNIISTTAIQHPGAHDQQHPEKAHKVGMILEANAIAHPRAMMIETCHTAIADAAVFGAYGTTH